MQYHLTFDGAPEPNTANLLTVLAAWDVKATFFVEGHRIEGQEDLLRRITAEGHALGNHTFTHQMMTDMNWPEARAEIVLTEEKIARTTGVRTRIFRPPWGEIPQEILSRFEQEGYRMVLWNTSVRDWETEGAEQLADRLVACCRDGVIPVLHDRIAWGPDALRLAIPRLLDRGVRFAPLATE